MAEAVNCAKTDLPVWLKIALLVVLGVVGVAALITMAWSTRELWKDKHDR